MSDYVPDISEELLAGFVDEAPEYLEILDDGLMALEQKAQGGSGLITLDSPEDHSRMNEMFRAAHSFKGLGAAMGFDKIRDLTHVMETLFDHLRMGKLALADHAVETLFKVIDRLKALIDELTNPPDAPVEIDDCVSDLEAILRGETDKPAVASSQPEIVNTVEDNEAPEAIEPNAPSEAVEADDVETDAAAEAVPALGPDAAVLDNPELAHLFVDTTLETLDELNTALLKLEETPDDAEAINDVFRCAHNIKGATGAAGCIALYHMTHEMETALDLVRSHELELSSELMQAIFAAADRVRADVTLIKQGDMSSLTGDNTVGTFAAWLSATATPAKMPEHPAAAPVPPAKAAERSDTVEEVGSTDQAAATPPSDTPAADGEDGGDMVVHVRFPKDFVEAEVQAYLIFNKLSEFGDVLSSVPDVDSLDGTSPLIDIRYNINTNVSPRDIETVIGVYNVESVSVTRGEFSPTGEVPVESAPPVPAPPAAPSPAAAAAPSAPPEPASSPAPLPTTSPASRPAASAAPAADSGRKDAPRVTAKPSETIRVDLERLDQLMNLGGELVINKARLTQIHGRFDPLFHGQNLGYVVDDMSERVDRLSSVIDREVSESAHSRRLSEIEDAIHALADGFHTIRDTVDQFQSARSAMNDFSEALHALNRVSEGIQKGIMETRMVSVGPLFQRFRRVVRDISKSTGKNVNLVLRGEQTELDKRMIDELGDPLTHMIRNSVDHGIESPEERQAAGKPASAEVVLNAYHRGRHICIEVRDDGKGVNIPRVKEKIIEREMATPTDVERMSDKEIVQYIFKPGFSTAEKVTDLSGRGMGMDIVMNKLEQINGTVEVESVTGQGTVVTIKLPLTLAIITAILAKIGDYVYAIPLDTVAEIITASYSDIQFIQKKRVVRVRERVIPVAFFEQMFAVAGRSLRTQARRDETLTLVILEMQNERVGLVVDELIGQEDVVIKSIAENYRNVPGITGASIMGDGRVSLILDVAGMMTMFAERSDEFLEAVDDATSPSTEPALPPPASKRVDAAAVDASSRRNKPEAPSAAAPAEAPKHDSTREHANVG